MMHVYFCIDSYPNVGSEGYGSPTSKERKARFDTAWAALPVAERLFSRQDFDDLVAVQSLAQERTHRSMQRWFVEFLSLFVPSSSALLSSFAHLSSLLRVEVKYDISSRKS